MGKLLLHHLMNGARMGDDEQVALVVLAEGGDGVDLTIFWLQALGPVFEILHFTVLDLQ